MDSRSKNSTSNYDDNDDEKEDTRLSMSNGEEKEKNEFENAPAYLFFEPGELCGTVQVRGVIINNYSYKCKICVQLKRKKNRVCSAQGISSNLIHHLKTSGHEAALTHMRLLQSKWQRRRHGRRIQHQLEPDMLAQINHSTNSSTYQQQQQNQVEIDEEILSSVSEVENDYENDNLANIFADQRNQDDGDEESENASFQHNKTNNNDNFEGLGVRRRPSQLASLTSVTLPSKADDGSVILVNQDAPLNQTFRTRRSKCLINFSLEDFSRIHTHFSDRNRPGFIETPVYSMAENPTIKFQIRFIPTKHHASAEVVYRGTDNSAQLLFDIYLVDVNGRRFTFDYGRKIECSVSSFNPEAANNVIYDRDDLEKRRDKLFTGDKLTIGVEVNATWVDTGDQLGGINE